MVASVIGNFNTVPRQAHWIDCLSNNTLETPIVVIANKTKVDIKATLISHLIKNIMPNNVSTKG